MCFKFGAQGTGRPHLVKGRAGVVVDELRPHVRSNRVEVGGDCVRVY